VTEALQLKSREARGLDKSIPELSPHFTSKIEKATETHTLKTCAEEAQCRLWTLQIPPILESPTAEKEPDPFRWHGQLAKTEDQIISGDVETDASSFRHKSQKANQHQS
jgi:hypothetical protein